MTSQMTLCHSVRCHLIHGYETTFVTYIGASGRAAPLNIDSTNVTSRYPAAALNHSRVVFPINNHRRICSKELATYKICQGIHNCGKRKMGPYGIDAA